MLPAILSAARQRRHQRLRLCTAITQVRRPLLTRAPDPNQNATGIRHRPDEQLHRQRNPRSPQPHRQLHGQDRQPLPRRPRRHTSPGGRGLPPDLQDRAGNLHRDPFLHHQDQPPPGRRQPRTRTHQVVRRTHWARPSGHAKAIHRPHPPKHPTGTGPQSPDPQAHTKGGKPE